MRRRRLTAVVALAAAMFTTPALGAAYGATPSAGERGDYIVVLSDTTADSAATARTNTTRLGGAPADVGHVYQHALKGYSAAMTSSAAAALRRTPGVVSVERDQIAHLTDYQPDRAGQPSASAATAAAAAQTVPAGVKRIFAPNNPDLDIDGVDDARIDADIAIIDTGSDATHPDLNVVHTVDCANKTTCVDNAGVDDNGHGTHVAGSAAAIDNGVGVVGAAPGARIWSVKVLGSNGSGSFAGIVAGIDWVTARASTIEVINMSLGCDGCTDTATTTAITNAVNAGIVVVIAAGNSNKNASGFFPANHPDVITVSALADSDGAPGGTGGSPACRTDQDDTLASFSNWGSTVELAAPGVCIQSTALRTQPPCAPCIWDPSGYALASGTSMASPHVAGAAGYLASRMSNNNRADVLAIRDALIARGNTNWTDDSGDGVKERLLDIGAQFDPTLPTAKFTPSCTGTTCSFDASTSTGGQGGTLTSYAWTFGDATTGSGKTVSHTYATNDKVYTATLTVTNNTGKKSSTSQDVVVGNPPPVASFTNSCSSPRVCSFDASASSDPGGSISSYAWTFGDGTTGTGKTVSHTYPAPGGGTYTVKLTVTDNQGKTATTSKTVTPPPNQLPVPAISVGSCLASTHGCYLNGYQTKDPDGGLATTFTYAWDYGDGTTGTGVSVYHSFPAAGTYTVKLTVTDDEGTSATTTKSVTAP